MKIKLKWVYKTREDAVIITIKPHKRMGVIYGSPFEYDRMAIAELVSAHFARKNPPNKLTIPIFNALPKYKRKRK